MKGLLYLCLVIAVVGSASAGLIGKNCSETTCTHKIGHISVNGANGAILGLNIPFWQITGAHQLPFKDFVVTIKNVNLKMEEPWLYLHNQIISSEENQVLVFKQISFLNVFLLLGNNNNISFELEYASGCEILEENDANFEKTKTIPQQPQIQPSNHWFFTWQQLQRQWQLQQQLQNDPTCWVLIPSKTQRPGQNATEILRTYVTLDNISLSLNDSIQVIDMLEGTTPFSVKGNTTNAITKINKSNSTFRYGNSNISTAILINFDCPNSNDCNEAEFLVTSKNLQQNDLECIKENQCLFDIISPIQNCPDAFTGFLLLALNETVAFNSINMSCPAFDLYISEEIYLASLEDDDNEAAEIEARGGFNLSRCRLKSLKGFCEQKQCAKRYRPGNCRGLCLYIKHKTKVCNYRNPYFGK